MQIIDYFLLMIFIHGISKKLDEKKSKEEEQTFAELTSSHIIAVRKRNVS